MPTDTPAYFPWGRPGSGAPVGNTRKQRFLETQLHLASPQRYFAQQDTCKTWERPHTAIPKYGPRDFEQHSPLSSGRSSKRRFAFGPDRLEKRLWWERGRADHVKEILKNPEPVKDPWARPRLAVTSSQSFRVRPRNRPSSSIFASDPAPSSASVTPRINRNALFFCAATN